MLDHAVETALGAWREAERVLAAAIPGSRDERQALEVVRSHRETYNRLVAERLGSERKAAASNRDRQEGG